MNRYLLSLCMLLFSIATYAQRITVSGKVTAGGEGLPGVTVAVKGSNHGTITSIDGDYSLQTEPQNTLVFSFIGYESQEIQVNGRKVINVEMQESSIAIDEVVITVPYGTA